MKPRNLALWLSLVVAVATPAAVASEKDLALVAEQAGKLREAVAHYANAFRELQWTDAAKNELETKIIALATQLDPPPAIPEEAERRAARGRSALKTADTPADLADAAKELLDAVNQAPWWPDAHFNLGVVHEKQGEHAKAINDFKRYLAANPKAEDVKAVKERIYELEFQIEKKQKTHAAAEDARSRAAAQAEADRALAARMVGAWSNPEIESTFNGRKVTMLRGYHVRISVDGTKVTFTCIGTPAANLDRNESWWNTSGLPLPYIEGEIKNSRLVGIEHTISYGSRGASLEDQHSPPKQIDWPVEFSSNGSWFKLCSDPWEDHKGKRGDMFYGREKP